MRKLVTLREVFDISPIEGADVIELAHIDGWQVVVKKGEFKVGDLGVYFEIDSLIPIGEEGSPFAFLSKIARLDGDTWKARIKTIRLRGQVSQGLLLPLSALKDVDLSPVFGVEKYEPPVSANLAGLARGNFPSWIPKTDQERCLAGDVVISTDIGDLTIKEIVDNKFNVKVLSYNHDLNVLEYKLVTNWSVLRNNNDWLKIKLTSGKELICTRNHKIWAEDIKSYRNAEDLVVGQIILRKTD